MRSARRAVTALAVALTGLLVLAGCGVPRDSAPRAVPAGQVDPRLLAESSSTPAPSPTGGSTYRVAFVTPDNTLQLIPRRISPAPARQQVQQLLDTLATGPDSAEHAHGLSTALPSDAALALMDLQNGQAVVAINGGTKDPDARRLPLSVAQVVLTLTSHPAVHAVSIFSDGQPVEAPLADGLIAHRPLTAADYASLLTPRRTPSPTRSP
jgi:Sporulation and spore germination